MPADLHRPAVECNGRRHSLGRAAQHVVDLRHSRWGEEEEGWGGQRYGCMPMSAAVDSWIVGARDGMEATQESPNKVVGDSRVALVCDVRPRHVEW